MENKLREEIEKIVSQITVDGMPLYAMENIEQGDRSVYWGVIEELETLINEHYVSRSMLETYEKASAQDFANYFGANDPDLEDDIDNAFEQWLYNKTNTDKEVE